MVEEMEGSSVGDSFWLIVAGCQLRGMTGTEKLLVDSGQLLVTTGIGEWITIGQDNYAFYLFQNEKGQLFEKKWFEKDHSLADLQKSTANWQLSAVNHYNQLFTESYGWVLKFTFIFTPFLFY